MTLTPNEIDQYAQSSGLWCGYPFIDGVMLGYWRLLFDRPSLDMEDAQAIADRYNATRPPGKVGERWIDVTRSTKSFWRSRP